MTPATFRCWAAVVCITTWNIVLTRYQHPGNENTLKSSMSCIVFSREGSIHTCKVILSALESL